MAHSPINFMLSANSIKHEKIGWWLQISTWTKSLRYNPPATLFLLLLWAVSSHLKPLFLLRIVLQRGLCIPRNSLSPMKPPRALKDISNYVHIWNGTKPVRQPVLQRFLLKSLLFSSRTTAHRAQSLACFVCTLEEIKANRRSHFTSEVTELTSASGMLRPSKQKQPARKDCLSLQRKKYHQRWR